MGSDIRELFRATNPGKTLFIGDREADQKYYIDFSSVRGGQIIEDLKNNIALWSPEEPTCQLFTGHIGCGKSTELLRLKAELEEKGFHVVYYESLNLDWGDVDVGDILLAITHSISKSLEDVGIKLKASYFQKLFGEIKDILHTPMEISEVEFSVGIAKITSQAKESPKLRNKLRGYLEPRTDSILRGINQEFLEQGIKKLKQQGKNGLVVIADNLDRIFPTSKPWGRCQPEYLFIDRGSQLRGLDCHVVYTMPLALRFSNEYETLIQRFMSEPKILPMVPVQLRNGGSHTEGMALLRQMVLARAFPELSSEQRLDKITKILDSPETLDRLCYASGGHVRNLLRLLNDLIKKEQQLPLSRQSLESVIRDRRHRMVLPITPDEWKLLRQVRKTKKVVGDEGYQTLIRSMFVYEYLDQEGSWFDINPILAEAPEFQYD